MTLRSDIDPPVRPIGVETCPKCRNRHPRTIPCPWCTGRVRGFTADGPVVGEERQ